MSTVNGTCDPRFEEVRRLFLANLDSGEELGASLVVNLDGKNVVDIWGGHTTEDRTKSWEEDTITVIWSSTKCVLSLAALMLIDRGLLDPYEKVSKYWPEFAQNGKESIEIRHVLSHSSGVAGWDTPLTIEDVINVPRATKLLEEQAPWWAPGSASGYHAFTMGHLIGELIRRTTGKTMAQFIREDIAIPLGADFHLNPAEEEFPRMADIIPSAPGSGMPADFASKLDPTSVAAKTLLNPRLDFNIANTPAWRNAQLGSADAYSNARGLARACSAISLGGTVDGTRLLSPKTIDLIFQEQTNGADLVMMGKFRFGLGYALPGKGTAVDWLPEGRICTWGGMGGSLMTMDVDKRLAISYVMTKMQPTGLGSECTRAYIRAVYNALESS